MLFIGIEKKQSKASVLALLAALLLGCASGSRPAEAPLPDPSQYELQLWADARLEGRETPLLQAGLATGQQSPLVLPYGAELLLRAEVQGPKIGSVAFGWQPPQGPPQTGKRFTYRADSAGPFSVELTAQITPRGAKEALELKRSLRLIAAGRASVFLIEPSEDRVLKPGQQLVLKASGADGKGRRPIIMWTVEVEGVQRLLGFGEHLATDRFSVGYNRVRALGLDAQGRLIRSEPVGILVPDRKEPTRIVTPETGAVLREGRPVYLFARGADLEHSLDGEPFRPGPGSLRIGLSPGTHSLKVRGRRGSAEVTFEVVTKDQQIGQVAALEGRLLRQLAPGTWETIPVGASLAPGDRLRAAEGWAELHFEDGLVYQLKSNRSVQLLPGGGLRENLSAAEAAVYRIIDEKGVQQVVEQLKPYVSQLEQLLEQYEVQSVRSQDQADLENLLHGIRSGEIQLEEIILY